MINSLQPDTGVLNVLTAYKQMSLGYVLRIANISVLFYFRNSFIGQIDPPKTLWSGKSHFSLIRLGVYFK